jgi:hypothetical protein
MIITNLNPDQTHIQTITDSAIVWLSGSRHKLSGFSDYKASLRRPMKIIDAYFILDSGGAFVTENN